MFVFHAALLRLQNELYCVGWGVKLYSLTHLPSNRYFSYIILPLLCHFVLFICMLVSRSVVKKDFLT